MNKKRNVLLLFLGIITTLPSTITPILLGMIVDKYLETSNASIKIVVALLAGAFSILVAQTISTFFQQRLLGFATSDKMSEFQEIQYKKMQNLKVSYFDKYNSGWYYTRMSVDSTSGAELKVLTKFQVYLVSIGLISNIIALVVLNYILGLTSIAIALLAISTMIILRKWLEKYFKIAIKKIDLLNTNLANSLDGIREIKNFNGYKIEQQDFNFRVEESKKAWLKVHKRSMVMMGIFFTIENSITLAVVLIGALMIYNGDLSAGTLTAIIGMVNRLVNPIKRLLESISQISRGKASLSRINDLLSFEEESNLGNEILINKGTIEFKNVTLKYNEKVTALKNINLSIKKGQNVAIVGSTGSGKTTLLKALVKHYPISSGQILIDGLNINNYSNNSVRKAITYISQEPYLTNDTIKNNILFTTNDYDDQKYKKVIKLSESNFINKTSEKDGMIVGPNGVKLSGGQRQRVSIARGLFKESNIILFDESTSALDNVTEKKIQKNIENWTKDKTTITIAHRLSTIKNADLVVVMEKGEIIEQGSYSELIGRKSYFYEMLNR